MKEVKLQNGYAETRINANQIVRCVLHNGKYDLQILGYEYGGLSIGYIYEDAKRLSTINKYAKEYGVEFVA